MVVDTSGADCTVLARAPGRADAVASSRDLGRGHDRHVARLACEALQMLGVEPAQVSRVGVCVGPGSFAGVRVGVAFARGFAAALGVDAVGVTALDVWGRSAALAAAQAGDAAALCVGVHDARRGEVSWRAFQNETPLSVRVGAPVTEPVAAARAALDALAAEAGGASIWLAGSGAALLTGDTRQDSGVRAIDPSLLADHAAAADPRTAPAFPFYHRAPDASPPRKTPRPAAPRA